MFRPLSNKITSLVHYNVLNFRRECFCSTAEAEGLLITDTYPFSLGAGSVSETAFGIPIFFKHRVLGVALSSVSDDLIPLVEFFIEHKDSNGQITIIDNFFMNNSKFVSRKISSSELPAGQICIRVGEVSELSDQFAKYRVAIYLQAEESLE